MATIRTFAEILRLLDVNGPFIDGKSLERVFPQGFDATPPEVLRRLRGAYAEWEADGHDPAIHYQWLRFVLREVLDWHDDLLREGAALPPHLTVRVAQYGETLAPTLALVSPPGREDGGAPRLAVLLVPPGQDLERPLAGSHWKASPAQRMADLLRAAGVELGLLTNGEAWMLIRMPRDAKDATTSFITWYAELWLEEPETLRAWRSLVGLRRIIGAAPGEALDELLAEGAREHETVALTLGNQVRRAIQVLLRRIDEIDKDRDRALLAGRAPEDLYRAALTVMMRLVFLFYAEERALLLRGNDLYDRYYAVATIRAQLQENADQHGEERLERFGDAWGRLLATFRAVFGGVHHEAMPLHAYGGDLFDPDAYPFLEGRLPGTTWRATPADPLPIDNRTTLYLLKALQEIQERGTSEPQRVTFRALDVEQIGHVYEGLLDHTARRADAAVLGLDGRAEAVPEVPLAELEAARDRGADALLDLLKVRTGKTVNALRKRLATPLTPVELARLRVACDNDAALMARIQPFAALLLTDFAGRPAVFVPGSIYVTAGEDRRSTGTHYTPRRLTAEIVRHTLDPLVYHGPAEGLPEDQWRLRPAREILALRVCDPAMGSGAFLVQAARYLSERLLEAWEIAAQDVPPAHEAARFIAPDGSLVHNAERGERIPTVLVSEYTYPSETLFVGSSLPSSTADFPHDSKERENMALRLICDRCLFGVDRNPMAVEMAKLSLWIATMARDLPFTFLDHALRCGDSLLGADLHQLRAWSLEPGVAQLDFMSEPIRRALDEAERRRRLIARQPVRDVRDAREKARLLAEAEAATALVRLGADLLVGARLAATPKERDRLRQTLQADYAVVMAAAEEQLAHPFTTDHLRATLAERQSLQQRATALLAGRHPFHWPLEFPEVFDPVARDGNAGFDAILCNPPFMGGQKITGALGVPYRDYLVDVLAQGKKGSADLCAYFFLRAGKLLRQGGDAGMLATNTIAQGDTREVGLDQLATQHVEVMRAIPSQPWPGGAALEIAQVWLRRGEWHGPFVLEGHPVAGITPFLVARDDTAGNPFRLAANANKSFIGSYVLGMGFVLTPEEAAALIARDPRNRDVLFSYLNGEDLNSRPDQSPSRWVINFHDWPLARAEEYPDCLAIVREKVKPERQRLNADGSYALRKPLPEKWWIYAEKRPALYATIAGMERVLVRARIANMHSMTWVPNEWVFNEKVVVFAYCPFTLLQSGVHEIWAREYSSSLRSDMQYTPSDCFETFPFPESMDDLEEIGAAYYAHRQGIMLGRQEGLTKTYNRMHDAGEMAGDIARLRELHAAMDRAVALAYGWGDLDLGHGFHQTKQGMRFTISPAARREVLARLLRLNHARYAAEVAAGLHAVPRKKGGAGKPGRAKGHPSEQADHATDATQEALWDAAATREAE
jgi:hypothetical protein